MTKTIILGGGCFWCTEAVFSELDGVKSTQPGYSGGSIQNPSYEMVCEGNTGHAEVAKVEYDPEKTCPRCASQLAHFISVLFPSPLARMRH